MGAGALLAAALLVRIAGASPADDARIHADSATTAYTRRDMPSVLHEMAAAVALAPGHAQYRFMYATALFRAGQFDSSAIQYRRAAALRPWHPDTYLNLGFAEYRRDRFPGARDAWRRAVEQAPGDHLMRLALALGESACGDSIAAAREIATAWTLSEQLRQVASPDFDVRWGTRGGSEIQRLLDRSGIPPSKETTP